MADRAPYQIRFFHTADIHFGVENYGRIDAETGVHTRLLDFEKALATCVDAAIEQHIDIFFFAGDAYKTAYPTPTQQKLLMQQFFRLQEAGIAVVIVVGNHDHPLSFGRAHALDVFGAIRHQGFYVVSRPQALTIETRSGVVQVIGVPWPMRHNLLSTDAHHLKTAAEVTEYLSSRVITIVSKLASELKKDIPTVLVGHLTVANGIFSGSERKAIFGTDPLFLPSHLAVDPVDYVALGHLHRHQNLNESGRCPVVYSGSPERVDFGERNEPKGYCSGIISVDAVGNKTTEYAFIELVVRPMIQVDVKLAVDAEVSFTDQVLAAIAKHDLTKAIVKVVYHVPEKERDTVDVGAVQRACRHAHYVTGIIPVHVVATRTQRVSVNEHMEGDELLQAYFASRNIDAKEQKRLLECAHQLQETFEKQKDRLQGDEAHDE
jgi:exonuclease SbcD